MNKRKRREDSFFGMHFDFHANKEQRGIGDNCEPHVIERLLQEVKPDYVQCDTKGHNGVTSYPTKVGYPAPEMTGDILRMWRDVTARYDVALYAHHSGVWDDYAIAHNPDWAAVNADGVPDKSKTSVFGPYTDKLLIPQLIEMAVDYGLDGVWIDGDCWAVVVDYCEYAKTAYRQKYNEDPPMPDDENYKEYLKFNRQGFRDYLDRYVTEVHKAAPDFQIASNWMYTSMVPEQPTANVDFISGDYSPNNSINTSRYEGRCMQNQGKPWDLMAWGFSTPNAVHCVKEYEQLCQEAASVIMLGGGFQFYNRQLVGTVQEWAIPMWAEIAKFCRAREEICFKAEPVPQIGMILSEKAFYKNKKDLFTGNGNSYMDDMKGLLFAILDNQYSVEILMTHQMYTYKPLDNYGLIILPDMETIESDLREQLLDYVNGGGSLLITGYHTTQLFLPYLDVDIIGGSENNSPIYVCHNNRFAPIKTMYNIVTPNENASSYGAFYFNDSYAGQTMIASTVTNYGDGKIAGIYFNAGMYQNGKTVAVRDFIGDVIGHIFTPTVRVSGSKQIEISLMKKDGKLCVNLLNTSGVHSDQHYGNFDIVNKLYDIEVEISYPNQPTAVILEPESIPADYVYEDGKIKLTLDSLHIHTVITIE